jgi:hypothetical protein
MAGAAALRRAAAAARRGAGEDALAAAVAGALGALEGALPDEGGGGGGAPQDELVGLRELADVQTLLECALSWCVFPVLLLSLHAFGDASGLCLAAARSPGRVADEWVALRRPSKAFKLEPGTLALGLARGAAELDALAALAPRALEATWRYAREERGGMGSFVLSRFLADLALADAAFAASRPRALDALGSAASEMDGLPQAARADALLAALQAHLRVSEFVRKAAVTLGALSVETPAPARAAARTAARAVSGAIGTRLSRLVAEPHGVRTVIVAMLEHVPAGNVAAFQKVAELIANGCSKDGKSSTGVEAQLLELLGGGKVSGGASTSGGTGGSATPGVVRRAAAMVVSELARRWPPPRLLERLLIPLLPLLSSGAIKGERADEAALGAELARLWQLLEAAPAEPRLLAAMAPVAGGVFECYAFSHAYDTRLAGEARAALAAWASRSQPAEVAAVLRRAAASYRPLGSLGESGQLQRSAEGGLDAVRCARESGPESGLDKAPPLSAPPRAEVKLPRAERRTVKVEGCEGAEEQGQQEEEHAAEEDAPAPLRESGLVASQRVQHAVRFLQGARLKAASGQVFTQSLRGMSLVFQAQVQQAASLALADVLFLERLLGGADEAETGDDADDGAFELSPEFVEPAAVVSATAELLGACAGAMGLWTFESGSASGAGSEAAATAAAATAASLVKPTPLGLLALDVVPAALAVASALASHGDNDTLWSAAARELEGRGDERRRDERCRDKRCRDEHCRKKRCRVSRFAELRPMLAPLEALARAGAPDAALALAHAAASFGAEAESAAVRRVAGRLAEVADAAIATRITIFSAASHPELNTGGPPGATAPPAAPGDPEPEGLVSLDPFGNALAAAKDELASVDPPVRAMGVDRLRQIVLPPAPKQTAGTGSGSAPRPGERHTDAAVAMLLVALRDADAYVYLSAVRGLAAACEADPARMLPRLVRAFTEGAPSPLTGPAALEAAESGAAGGGTLPLAARLRLGEVLKLASWRAGATLPRFAPSIISALALASRHHPAGRPPRVTDGQGRMRAPASVRAPAQSAEMEAELGDLRAALEDTFRSSCLANLADVAMLAPWAAFQQASTLAALAKNVLGTELKGPGAVTSRRAAAYLLLQLVRGALAADAGTAGLREVPLALAEVLRAAAAASSYDPDAVVRLHSDRARAAVDELVRRFVVPDPNKPKILAVSLGLDRL